MRGAGRAAKALAKAKAAAPAVGARDGVGTGGCGAGESLGAGRAGGPGCGAAGAGRAGCGKMRAGSGAWLWLARFVPFALLGALRVSCGVTAPRGVPQARSGTVPPASLPALPCQSARNWARPAEALETRALAQRSVAHGWHRLAGAPRVWALRGHHPQIRGSPGLVLARGPAALGCPRSPARRAPCPASPNAAWPRGARDLRVPAWRGRRPPELRAKG